MSCKELNLFHLYLCENLYKHLKAQHIVFNIDLLSLLQVVNSIWEKPHDMTSRLNLKLLEEQFALKEREIQAPQGML